jgi:hypothetical protein
VAIDQAEQDTRQRVQIEGRLMQTALSEGVLTGDQAGLAKLDELVQSQILSTPTSRRSSASASGSAGRRPSCSRPARRTPS